jgi:hypothetical protein
VTLPSHIIERYGSSEYAGMNLYGYPLDTMTRDELLCLVRMLAEQNREQHLSHQEALRTIAEFTPPPSTTAPSTPAP